LSPDTVGDFFAPSVLLRSVFQGLWPLLKIVWPLFVPLLLFAVLRLVTRARWVGQTPQVCLRPVAADPRPAAPVCVEQETSEQIIDDGPGYPIICVRCGKADTVPFEPCPGKAVLCRDCYAQAFRRE
jgi:CxxC-x17-CxxC domain-containing protein